MIKRYAALWTAFFLLMFKSATPYALTSLASLAYLPVGLYTVSHFAPAEFLGAYNFSHKLLLLASSVMVFFIYSSVLTLHQRDSRQLSLRDQALFTGFIIAVMSPLSWSCNNDTAQEASSCRA